MSLYVQHVIGLRPSNRVAPGPHPGLKNYLLEWVPRDTHGVSQIEVNKMWRLCLAGGAAIGRGRVSSGNATDGDGDCGVVDSVSQADYEGHEGDAAGWAAGARKGGRAEGGRDAVEAREETGAMDEQGECTGCDCGTGRGEGEEGTGGPGAQGREGDRRAGARRGNYPEGALNNHTGGHSAVAEGGGCARSHLDGLPTCCGGPQPLVRVWLQGPGGWCQRQVEGMDGLKQAVGRVWGAPAGDWWMVRGGRVLRDMEEDLFEDDHIQVRFRGSGGGGEGKEGQDKEQGGPLGGDNGALALEKMMERMRLQGEQLQLLAASTSGLRKEVEEFKSSKGKEKEEEREEPIPPITAANVARMEAAPHLPRWMSGQCKPLRELLGRLGEEWADEGMEGVEGGEGGAGADADITLLDPEDGGTPWDKFAWGI